MKKNRKKNKSNLRLWIIELKENCRMNKTLEYKSSQMISMLIEQLGVIFRKWSKDQ